MTDLVRDIAVNPVHLGMGAVAVPLPPFDGSMEWYEQYGRDTAADGVEGRLVTMHTFSEPWTTWEMHPHGHELVLCIAGEITLHQELPDGEQRTVSITAGQYIVNEPGTWHTADVDGSVTAVFVTAGTGTQIRGR